MPEVSSELGEDGLYDGPEPKDQFTMDFTNVVQHPGQSIPPTSPPQSRVQPALSDSDRVPRVRKDYVAALAAAVDVLGSRLLALIAVVGAVVMFGWTSYNPTPWQTYTDVAFAVVVVWPTIILHLRKG